jgi:hypothetical protein
MSLTGQRWEDSMLTNTNVRRHPFQNIEEVELSGLFDLMRLKNPTILDK